MGLGRLHWESYTCCGAGQRRKVAGEEDGDRDERSSAAAAAKAGVVRSS